MALSEAQRAILIDYARNDAQDYPIGTPLKRRLLVRALDAAECGTFYMAHDKDEAMKIYKTVHKQFSLPSLAP
jgi:hypothetical protein